MLFMLLIFLVNIGIFGLVVYKFPIFFKYLCIISFHRKRENLFYGSVFFAVAIAGIFLFSKNGELINFPITIMSFAGLFGCLAFVSSFFKINALKTPYKAVIFGIIIVFVLNSLPYFGDIVALCLKAYGLGALIMCYKLRHKIREIEAENISDDEKTKKIGSYNKPHYFFIHIIAQLAAITVIAAYSVMLRNLAMEMAGKITDEIKKTQPLSDSAKRSDSIFENDIDNGGNQ